MGDTYRVKPYLQWYDDEHHRWIDAAYTFGAHLMKNVRDEVLNDTLEEANPETKGIAEEIVLETIRSMMNFLSQNSQNDIDGKHKVTYALLARIEDEEGLDPLEVLELAPSGGDLAAGVSDWWNNEFWWNRKTTEYQSREPDGQ
jgi:hypothetical protein